MVWAKAARGGLGLGHEFDGKMYFTRDICEDEQIPKQLKVPVKSKPAKPAGGTVRFRLILFICVALPPLGLYMHCTLALFPALPRESVPTKFQLARAERLNTKTPKHTCATLVVPFKFSEREMN